ncbi:MAG: hypothetical protein H6735_33060 [Alphaproteobacteria bacterium]|nr:hypothetical protein [Alphaproteobacteria bacterium]
MAATRHLDLRQSTALTAVRLLEQAVLRARSGAQIFRVDVDQDDVHDALVAWADELWVPYEATSDEIKLYLLPTTFGEHAIHSHLHRAMVVAGLRGRETEQLAVA